MSLSRVHGESRENHVRQIADSGRWNSVMGLISWLFDINAMKTVHFSLQRVERDCIKLTPETSSMKTITGIPSYF